MEAPVKRSPLSSSDIVEADGTDSSGTDSSMLSRFGFLLGTTTGPNHDNVVADSARMKELTSLLSTSTGDDDVVLTLPCLDLRLIEGDLGKNDVLPQVGEHAAVSPSTEAQQATGIHTTGASAAAADFVESRPNMDASVLVLASDGQAIVELKAAQNIGKLTSWTRSTLSYASTAVGMNVSKSFSTLLNSRLRAWTMLLLRHSLSTGSDKSRSRLLSMLAANIQIKTVQTTFTTFPLPDAARGAKPNDSDIILPLLFEVIINITIQGKPKNVTLRAPGTISGKHLVFIQYVKRFYVISTTKLSLWS